MINSDEFTKRLQKVIDFYGESASSFSEKIGVQRSSISHILSGRNKPSLDFVMKILSTYPEVELYWLLNGKGSFPAETKTKHTPDLFSKDTAPAPPPKQKPQEIQRPQEPLADQIPNPVFKSDPSKQIERIVIFYTDGSFKNFENSI
ncbi:helix-turn-helix domain-containing protein [Formosa algae]|uniref:Transcriptional regulator with XRE-family HTH domain n=1 Tax=Formosa algae TaxID=225843 RepID=A0A9X0YLA3_9FLAO|nr:helix-turn-helix transcriptional regulator [Formosa algae]MBP1840862.1 transcriptional regulator with XRE-family HTH domain [Formosa algae]MDQ0336241.1 transcriptional regulator with XRE-family HTH domain [Formosa algae]OEI80012.1 transcriptional regulator [Formosa algae]